MASSGAPAVRPARSVWVWVALVGTGLVIAGAIAPYRHFPAHARGPDAARLIDAFVTGGPLGFLTMAFLPLLTGPS